MQRGPDSARQVRVCWNGAVATVSVSGELDVSCASALAEELLELAVDHPQRVVLDLDDVASVDVAGGRAFNRALQAFDSQCPMIICGLRPVARKVFLATDFLEFLEGIPKDS